ncbi:MAG: phosphoribosylformylglycinamidine synthase subunit PurQ [Candidatus Anstonellaceae archaeon]
MKRKMKQKAQTKPTEKKAKHAAQKKQTNAESKKKPIQKTNMAKSKRMAQKKQTKTKMKKRKPFPLKKPVARAKMKKQFAAAQVVQMKTKTPYKATPSAQAGERKPKVLVLSGFGLNSEAELAHAFTLAGADASIVHFSDISSGKEKLEDYQIFAIPGGWAFGDDIASGKVLANKLKSSFRSQFEAFVSSGKPVIGICNGFQVLAKFGALPNIGLSFQQEATLEHNASGKFEDRWVYLKPQKSVCKYLEGVPFIHCPVRHGEGRFVAKDDATLRELEKRGLVVLKYSDEKLSDNVPYPLNPNGASNGIAGICDSTGKIFALMPHPECSVRKFTFPRWTAGVSHEKNSLRFFENIVKEGKKFA